MKRLIFYIPVFLLLWSCGDQKPKAIEEPIDNTVGDVISINANDFTSSSDSSITAGSGPITLAQDNWLAFDLDIIYAGRYRVSVYASSSDSGLIWIEDYYDNTDGRTYDVTGKIVPNGTQASVKEGSPFNVGTHKIKVHANGGSISLDKVEFELMIPHQDTPQNLTQKMDGEEWQLVWSDEFDGTEVDTSKWTYDIGDWGWGNNELQYYTDSEKNSYIQDGSLVIEAKKQANGSWTSARLTTRGKVSFTYGKIEFKALVPKEKGNWAAGWTLGDSYRDELSWPYCGEIDILESVGYEVNDETGDGIAHATVHTPAYYFKIENQISSVRDVEGIANEFHTYSVQWTPTEIRGYVDGEEYYLYDKTANEKEWPFNQAQNIILNLAMGGGWGGAEGMDTTVTSQKFILDYVRVYDRR